MPFSCFEALAHSVMDLWWKGGEFLYGFGTQTDTTSRLLYTNSQAATESRTRNDTSTLDTPSASRSAALIGHRLQRVVCEGECKSEERAERGKTQEGL